MPRTSATPKYRKHRASGQAVVTLNGRDVYLGPHGSKASKATYDRYVGEWMAAGRCLPAHVDNGNGLTIVELCAAYWRFAKGYYGNSESSLDRVRITIRKLRESYGPTPAVEFGPLALQAFLARQADSDLSRRYVNHLGGAVKRIFRWATSQELLPVATYQALSTVAGLRRGRSTARETAPIAPVDDATIEATLPFMPPAVATMVQVQRLCGCRPAEIVIMRPCDVDRSGDVWSYRPQRHKTEYREIGRVIFLGPKAQTLLLPWMLRAPESYCFSPQESEDKHNANRRADRKSPMTPSQSRRRRRRNPQVAPGDYYETRSYAQAVRRACKVADKGAHKANPDIPAETIVRRWTPLQLRHSAATEVRAKYDLEAAQAILGHQHARITEVYAERNQAKAEGIMREIG